jgi:hypothetical protein
MKLCLCVVAVSRLQQERVALLQELHQVRAALRDKESEKIVDRDREVVVAAEGGGSRPRGGDAKNSRSRAGRTTHPDPKPTTNSNYRREKSLVVDLNKEVRS